MHVIVIFSASNASTNDSSAPKSKSRRVVLTIHEKVKLIKQPEGSEIATSIAESYIISLFQFYGDHDARKDIKEKKHLRDLSCHSWTKPLMTGASSFICLV